MITEFREMLEIMPEASIKQLTNTLAHIFRHDYKENFISDWLAFLLNPIYMETVEPLERLLHRAGFYDFNANLSDEIEIEREYTFDDGRRIDFLIHINDQIIAIENKIWSGLQDNQLKDYSKQIRDLCKKEGINTYYCIFLCPQKNQIFTDKENISFFDFKTITYEDLINDFKEIRLNCISNLRAAVLMQDFITHMEEYIMSNNSLDTVNFETLKFANEYSEKIERLNSQITSSKEKFGKMLKSRMLELVPNGNWDTNSNNSYYYQLFKQYWNEEYQVHFEILPEKSKENKYVFPPQEIQIVLHTRELKKYKIKDSMLYNLQDEFKKYLEKVYGSDKFYISYITEEEFNNSIDKIMNILKESVLTFETKIDEAIKSL